MKLFTREDVASLLEPEALIDAVAVALADVSGGRASVPPRIAAHSPAGLLGAMVAYVPSLDTLSAKLVSLFPENRDRPTHQALIAVFDARTGTPVALMDGTEVTAQRTAAASALAARLLARDDAQMLAIIGTGVQALWHARYVARVRKFRETLIAGRDAAKAEALARQIPGARAVSIEQAVRAADVICATTHSSDTVVRSEWVRPGAHVGSVGSSRKGGEIESSLFDRALIAVEARSSAFAPFPAGASELQGRDAAAAVELGELVAKTRRGRSSAEQITVYKSVGLAAEDAAGAALVLRRGAGREVGI